MTRGDFYIRKDDGTLEWIGSNSADCYREGVEEIIASRTVEEYRSEVHKRTHEHRWGTKPEEGWPWPWDDSTTTDCAYIWNGSAVECYSWGKGPYNPDGSDDERRDMPRPAWPNMKHLAMDSTGIMAKSGLIIIGGR